MIKTTLYLTIVCVILTASLLKSMERNVILPTHVKPVTKSGYIDGREFKHKENNWNENR